MISTKVGAANVVLPCLQDTKAAVDLSVNNAMVDVQATFYEASQATARMNTAADRRHIDAAVLLRTTSPLTWRRK